MKRTFLVHLAATLLLTGIIWYCQIVHYPLFALVGADRFGPYQAANIAFTALCVLPPMFAELITGVMLHRRRPAPFTRAETLAGLALLGLIWLSTAAAATTHVVLGHEYTKFRYDLVLWINWIRVAAWTARAWLVLRLAARAMPSLTAPR